MRRIRISVSTAAVMVVMTISACAQPGTVAPPAAPAAVVDTVLIVDTVRIETESQPDVVLQDQLARLQIQLIERTVLLDGLREQLDATRQEVVRNLAKLQSQASRAEAASGMAEADIALQELRRTPGGEALPEFLEAESRIAESSIEFGDENYGGALYLANQARARARSGRSRLRTTGGAENLRAGESLFAVPVPLQTVGRSNVGREGWIFHTLVTAR